MAKKKKGKKAKSPPKEDKSKQLSDEEQAAQAEATRLAARKADAEAAAAAAAAAQKALDALPKGVLATALADGRVHKIVRGHALRVHEQHHSKKKKRRKKADIRGSEVKLFREATDTLPALLKDAEIERKHFHHFDKVKEAALELFGHDLVLCRPYCEDESEDAWWRELEAEDRGDHASFHAPGHVKIHNDKDWLDTIKAWDRFAAKRYERKAVQFSERYAHYLEHPQSNDDIQRTLDEVWEFAERPENLPGVTDGLLLQLVHRCSLDMDDEILVSGIRASWRLADQSCLMASRLQGCGYVHALIELLRKGIPDRKHVSELTGLRRLRDKAHSLGQEKKGRATREKHGFVGRRTRSESDRDIVDDVAYVAIGALLCFARQCRHSEIENSESLEVLEGAAAAYYHDDHLVLLALGGLYDVFSKSRIARRSYANDCGLFALSDLMRTFPTLEAARYAVAVALRLCTSKDTDVASLAGVSTTSTVPGLADALRACVELARACARACVCDGLREVEEDSNASAPAPAPAINVGIVDDRDARASHASREERSETLNLTTRAAHAFLTLRAATKTTEPGLEGDACALLVEECTQAFERSHDLDFAEPCRVASQLLALGLQTGDADPSPSGIWRCLEQLARSKDPQTQLALALVVLETAQTADGRAAVVGLRAWRRICRLVSMNSEGGVVSTLAQTLALVSSSSTLPSAQCEELVAALDACSQWQQCLIVPTRAGPRSDALVFVLVAFVRCSRSASQRNDHDALAVLVRGVRLCCQIGALAAKKAGRMSRDARILETVCRASLCAIRMLMEYELLYESSDLNIMPFARELLREKEQGDDEALLACRRDVLAVLWRVSVDTEFAQDPSLQRTPSSLVLSLDRLTFSKYGSIDTSSELTTQTSTLLLWLVCHSRRHRKRLERMHNSKQLIEAPSAALASDRCDGICRAALFAIQWLASRNPKTKAPLAQKCAKGLSRLVQMERSALFRKEALHCLLNLSTGGKDATTVLAEHGLAALVDVATAPDESDVDVVTRELAVSTLSNLQRDARARFLAYCQRLDAGFAPVVPRRLGSDEPEATPELPRIKRPHLTKRYENWFLETFKNDEYVPRLMRPYGPPQPSRPQSATYRKHPGKACIEWGRHASTLWTPVVEPEKDPYFAVRAVREPIPPRPKSAPARRKQKCAALDATRPRAGSHRIGPAGRKGSVPTEKGHDPWTPLIVNAEAEKWPDDYSQSSSMVAQQLDKVCVVAPGGKPHCFTFNEARGGTMNWDTRAMRDTHLCAFKHVPGSVVGDMFSSYAFADPDGGPDQRYHLHHASRVPCEVLDPGEWLRPAEPPLWSDDDALSDLKTPAIDQLDDIDPLQEREAVDCPRCHKHHMPHLRSLELLGHARTPLGMLPRYTLHLLVEYVPPPPPVVHVETPRPVWKLAESIYAPRIKEADSHGFYNPEKVHARMLAQDLRILEEQPRWPKFINRLAGQLPDGSGTEAIVEAIRHEMLPMYRLLSQCMEYYGYRSSNADPFDMSQNAFFSLLRDSSLLDDKRRLSRGASHRGPAPAPSEEQPEEGTKITSELAQRIFVQVNVEVGNKDSKHNAANDDTAMMRHELVEALLRIAVAKGNVEQHAREHPEHAVEILSDALHHVLRDHLLHLPHDVVVDADEFRRRKLYCEEVDTALLRHKSILRGLFELYSGMHPIAGRTLFGLKEWFLFVEHSGLYARNLSRSEATHAFVFSRMKFIDEGAPKFRALSWVTFLEAFVRLVDRSVQVPSAKDMRELGCTQLTEFYEALTQRCDHSTDDSDADVERVHRYMDPDTSRSLAEKVSLTLMYCFQNLVIKYRGTVRTQTHSVRMGHFLSPQQQDRWFSIRGYKTRRADVEVRMKTTKHQSHVVRRDEDNALEALGAVADGADVEWAREHGLHSIGGVSRLREGLHHLAEEEHHRHEGHK